MPASGEDADHAAADFGAAFARQADRVVAAFSALGATTSRYGHDGKSAVPTSRASCRMSAHHDVQ